MSKTFTFIFYVHTDDGSGPARYLMQDEASSQTDANKRGKAFAKANRIRFIEATTEPVAKSFRDALAIEPFPRPR